MIKNILEPDDIYDLLKSGNIDSQIINLLKNTFGSHLPDFSAICLVQRWGLDNLPWAENWTEKAFDFLKPLTQTHLASHSILNGEGFGFEPEYKLDNLPETLNLPDFPNEVTLKVYAGKTVSITWLSRSHDVSSASYCDAVANNITCWQRNSKVVTAKEKDLELKLESKDWLLNSCVIQGDGLLIGITNSEKELIMYKFLGQTLQNITNQLRLGTPRVLQSFDLLKWGN